MPEDVNGGQAPTDPQSTDASGQESQTPPSSQTTDTTTSVPQDNGKGELSPEQLREALDKARKEAAKNRVEGKELAELRAFKAAQDEATRQAELAKLSETEKLQRQLAEYQQREAQDKLATQERIVRAEVKAAAATLGLNPALAAKLVDFAAIEYDDNGDPKNISDLLNAAVAEFGIAPGAQAPTGQQPTSQQPQTPNPGATNPQTNKGGVVAVTANQYLDANYKHEFRLAHGIDLDKAIVTGKATIVG